MSSEPISVLVAEDVDTFRMQPKQHTLPTTTHLFFGDMDIKPEISTGPVTDEWFSFRKLWKYTGPGLLM
ncbi:hypothetical protein BDF14DRAFT_93958 [Spinellus fusiger]|nr:hypothetical protein BDF14DRAFT_93958 [Spinellus fusiger]